jgi:hypothetical protein
LQLPVRSGYSISSPPTLSAAVITFTFVSTLCPIQLYCRLLITTHFSFFLCRGQNTRSVSIELGETIFRPSTNTTFVTKDGVSHYARQLSQPLLHILLLIIYYYHCYLLYARYVQLYTCNKPRFYDIHSVAAVLYLQFVLYVMLFVRYIQCCSCSVFTVCATCNVICTVYTVLQLFCMCSLCYM